MPRYGQVVARFTSDAAGHFRVALPPGRFLLYGGPRNTGFISGCRGNVVVAAHQWVQAHVACDTGLR